MALVLHVVVQVAVLDARSALVLAPDDLQRTVALVCLQTRNKIIQYRVSARHEQQEWQIVT